MTLTTSPPQSETGAPIIDTPARLVSGIGPRYQPGPVLARGGQGRVRRGADVKLGREVALKEPVSPASYRRLVSEAFITARLQHPAIIPVYDAGEYDDGVPFCAMKLVDGRSLHDVIAETSTFGDRLALLPRVLTVAEAIAYAHSRGVIHRDLKPANVLVGAFGETVVIDWGLAKELRASEADAPTAPGDAPDSAEAGADETAIGAVLGTPAYMAPEQARGERVDARADVYALGAMTYHLLAGAPPYAGEALRGDGRRRVLEGPPRPLRSLVHGLPPDLATIIDKAMAREPADRYADASELADDLGRFTRGQLVAAYRYGAVARLLRFVRRHRAAVAVAAIALAVLAATIAVSVDRVVAERDVARAERAAAVTQRQAAQDLVDYMIGEQRASLEKLGKLDLMEGIGQRVTAYYDQLAAQGMDHHGRRRRADALKAIGAAYQARGRHDDAVKRYRDALAIQTALLSESPRGEDDVRRVVDLHRAIGQVALQRGNPDDALVEANHAIALASPDLARPDWHRLRRDIVAVYNVLGGALDRRGRVAEALDAYRKALAIVQGLPDDVRTDRDLYVVQSHVADLEMKSGNSAHAAELYRASAEAAARRVAASPDDMRLRHDLVLALMDTGTVARTAADFQSARGAFDAARTEAETLVAREPDNAEWQASLLINHGLYGKMSEELDDLPAAQAAFAAAVAIAERLVERHPRAAQWHLRLALSQSAVASLANRRGDHRAARAAHLAALDAVTRARELEPDNARYRIGVGIVNADLAQTASLAGQHALSVLHYRRTVAVLEEAVAADPADTAIRDDLVTTYLGLAPALLAQGDVAAATALAQKALGRAGASSKAEPARVHLVEQVALGHGVFGQCLARQGQRAEARAQLDLAIADLQRLDAAKTLSKDSLARLRTFVVDREKLAAR